MFLFEDKTILNIEALGTACNLTKTSTNTFFYRQVTLEQKLRRILLREKSGKHSSYENFTSQRKLRGNMPNLHGKEVHFKARIILWCVVTTAVTESIGCLNMSDLTSISQFHPEAILVHICHARDAR